MVNFLANQLFCLMLSHVPSTADEAILPGGSRVPGVFLQVKDRFVFKTSAGKEFPIGDLQQVRFAEAPCPAPLTPLCQRLLLSNGDFLRGELIDLDVKQALFRMWNGKELRIPRSSLAAVTQPPGWHIISREGFESDPLTPGWKCSSPPRPGLAISGKQILPLDRPESITSWTIADSPIRGRVSFFLHQGDKIAGRNLEIIWTFRQQKETGHLRMNVDAKKFSVPSGLSMAPTTGWHLIQVEWSPTSRRLCVDDFVLLTESEIEGGVFTQLSFAVKGPPQDAPSWSIDEVLLERAEEQRRLPRPLSDHDAIWLAEGDQLFGKLIKADGGAVTLETKFGAKSLPWTQVRGVIFRSAKAPIQSAEAGQVILWTTPAPGHEPERLTGKLVELTPQTLILHHNLLGDVEVPRAMPTVALAGEVRLVEKHFPHIIVESGEPAFSPRPPRRRPHDHYLRSL